MLKFSRYHGFESVKITVSIGTAHFPRDGRDASGLFARAALYAAKEGGRNRMVDALNNQGMGRGQRIKELFTLTPDL